MKNNQEFGKYLYLGCGNHRMPKFTHVEINIGKRKAGPPDIIADITQHISLPDNSVDLIFSRATMEHLTYPDLINCLLENHRLLKKGGIVRMLVPDFDIMIQDYLNKLPPPKARK
jgi:predicted SAM-dependent methyltransferase